MNRRERRLVSALLDEVERLERQRDDSRSEPLLPLRQRLSHLPDEQLDLLDGITRDKESAGWRRTTQ